MFTIYCKNVGGRKFDRYFRSWEKAKEKLEEERTSLLQRGWEEIGHRNFMNGAKGFYVFDYTLKSTDGESATLSLVDGYFSD